MSPRVKEVGELKREKMVWKRVFKDFRYFNLICKLKYLTFDDDDSASYIKVWS